jgi:hypothetical protein
MDEATTIARLPRGLVVTPLLPPGNAVLLAVGAFITAADQADPLLGALRAAERKPTPWGGVLALRAPVPNMIQISPSVSVPDGRSQVEAVLRFPCDLQERKCFVNGVVLEPGAVIPMPIDADSVPFRVDDVVAPATAVLNMVLRVRMTADELAALRRPIEPEYVFPARDALQSSLVSLAVVGRTPGGQDIANVRVRVPVSPGLGGWVHGGRALRIGDTFAFDRGAQHVTGRIVGMKAERP